MPSKNSLKQYVENGYYHIYNRGVEKRAIFPQEQDYGVFLSYLKNYLEPKNTNELQKKLLDVNISSKERANILKLLRLNNFYDEISLLAFCLMPNHFHFLVKQNISTSIDNFMQSLLTRYVMYFNIKYKRVGPLFQGVYKGVLVESEPQLLYLTSYIHRNPLSLGSKGLSLQAQLMLQPSSYADYLGTRNTGWLDYSDVLPYFSRVDARGDYKSFVEQTDDYTLIKNLILDED